MLAFLLLLIAQNRVDKAIPGYDKPVVAFLPQGAAQPGLVFALHGTGGSGERFAGSVNAPAIAQAGYVVVCPTSLQGAWGTIATGGTPEGHKKDADFLQAIADVFSRDHNIHPDKIHFIGYSAGSTFSCMLVAHLNGLPKYRIRSICGHSGGLTAKGRAPENRSKETSVWILNGTADTGHVKESKNMADTFKESGYDCKYQEIPGAGHIFPLVPMAEIIQWWKTLDKDAPDYSKIKRARDLMSKKLYAQAYKAFEEAKIGRMTKDAEAGLSEIADLAAKLLADAKAKEKDQAKKALKDLIRQFAKTPHADAAQRALDELK